MFIFSELDLQADFFLRRTQHRKGSSRHGSNFKWVTSQPSIPFMRGGIKETYWSHFHSTSVTDQLGCMNY